MSIIFKRARSIEEDCALLVQAKADGATMDATPDDLRAACAAVGLVVDTGETYGIETNVVDSTTGRLLEHAEARLSTLTAPVEGEPSDGELRAIEEGAGRGACASHRALYRLGVQHERARQEKRIAEILHNVDTGLGVNEAGPLVYALNARRDEAERAWEEERAELVRTRQETQDKLSEARKELTDLRESSLDTPSDALLSAVWASAGETIEGGNRALYDLGRKASHGEVARWRAYVEKLRAAEARHQRTEPRGRVEGEPTTEELVALARDPSDLGVARGLWRAGYAAAEHKFRKYDYEPAWRMATARANENGDMLKQALATGLAACEELRASVEGLLARLGEHNAAMRRTGFTTEAVRDILLAYDRDAVSMSRAVEMIREIAPVRTEPRATDEELCKVFERAREDGALPNIVGLRAVAAKVRAEQCLVERAVAKGEGFSVVPASQGRWYVTAKMREQNVPASDVYGTLAAMLGEVGA